MDNASSPSPVLMVLMAPNTGLNSPTSPRSSPTAQQALAHPGSRSGPKVVRSSNTATQQTPRSKLLALLLSDSGVSTRSVTPKATTSQPPTSKTTPTVKPTSPELTTPATPPQPRHSPHTPQYN